LDISVIDFSALRKKVARRRRRRDWVTQSEAKKHLETTGHNGSFLKDSDAIFVERLAPTPRLIGYSDYNNEQLEANHLH
jgi:hypothetical protein